MEKIQSYGGAIIRFSLSHTNKSVQVSSSRQKYGRLVVISTEHQRVVCIGNDVDESLLLCWS